MDVPVLKYLDILIGLAVAMLLVATAVTAIVQVYLNSTFARARYLRDGLQELIAQIDPVILGPHKRYLAQRVQRHPLVSRGNTMFGHVTGWARNWLRRSAKDKPGLPRLNPGNVIQREELVAILLEWAASEGPLAEQDRQLANEHAADQGMLTVLRSDLARALANTGIHDPGTVIRQVRQFALDQEAANPQLPAANWRAQAVLQAAPSPFTAKVFAWFDNTVARVSTSFSLEARLLSCLAALAVCFVIQLDSFDLIRRLATDGKFRDAMVARADAALKRYKETVKIPPQPRSEELRAEAEKELNRAVEVLREPSLTVVPSAFVWEDVEQFEVIETDLIGDLVLKVGDREYPITATAGEDPGNNFLRQVLSLKVPVSAYRFTRQNCRMIGLVSEDPSAPVTLMRDKAAIGRPFRARDSRGIRARFGGVLFSWILVSLGAPFWYDLLKRLLSLRSLLAKKDDEDRQARQESQQPANAAPVTHESAPKMISDQPGLVEIQAVAALRAGLPGANAPEAGIAEAGTLVSVTGAVEGELIKGADGVGSRKWYRTHDGHYLWAGATDKP